MPVLVPIILFMQTLSEKKQKQIVQFIWFTNASNLVCDMVRNRHGSFFKGTHSQMQKSSL